MRKGTALHFSRTMLEDLNNVYIPSANITIPALVRFMRESKSHYTDPDSGMLKFQSAITQVSEELIVFIKGKRENQDLLGHLCDWYDSGPKWGQDTMKRGIEPIEGVCFNFLGATTPDQIPEMFSKQSIGGGITSRMIFVVEEKLGKISPGKELLVGEGLLDELMRDLEQIGMMVGEMNFTPKAEMLYQEWYTAYRRAEQDDTYAVPDRRFQYYCSRRAAHLWKLCMCLSASRDNTLEIVEEDFERARGLLELTEKKMPRAFQGVGEARFSDATDNVLRMVIRYGPITRSDVLKAFFPDIDALMIDAIQSLLSKAKYISVEVLKEKHDVMYHYIGDKG